MVDILHSIDLQITQGSSCALVGPSGSGKSSLLMVMAGLEQATSGRVTVL
ncbi:ATP-binding cassette domain-containing protein, partial [Planktomarina temperata]|nr:ATP-binding cassette domain-containing protein [Planktomarina temperata]